jgi:ubiquinone biosynthesis protein
MPPTYTMVFKALMTVEGIGKTLSPKLNFIDEAKPFIKEQLIERYAPERLIREGVETLTSTSRSLRSFSQAAPRLLRDLELGALSFKVDSHQTGEVIEALRRSTNRVIRALVFGSAAVAGTLALNQPGSQILGLPVITFGAYVVAVIAGWPLIFSLMSRR